jgi:hypothetical protein
LLRLSSWYGRKRNTVHTMVTSGGLQGSGQWISSVFYHHDSLMKAWRNGILKLLRTASRAGQLRTKMTNDQVMGMLVQEERWWSVKIQSFRSTQHFLKYAGRYIRRPPIAQCRITDATSDSVTFWTKDKKLKCRVLVPWLNSLTFGRNTFWTVTSTRFGTSVFWPHGR